MSKKVYIVTSGAPDCADYYVVGVFSNQKKAQDQLDVMVIDVEYNYAEMEEFELDPDINEAIRCGLAS